MKFKNYDFFGLHRFNSSHQAGVVGILFRREAKFLIFFCLRNCEDRPAEPHGIELLVIGSPCSRGHAHINTIKICAQEKSKFT